MGTRDTGHLTELFIEDDGLLRLAVTEAGELTELIVKENLQKPQAGDIYRGIIKSSGKKDRSVYIDIGTRRNAYLYLSEPAKSHRYKTGDRITVEILREESGKKGAKVTDRPSITDSYLVAEAGSGYGFSKNADSLAFEEKFGRIESIPGVRLIFRSAAASLTGEELALRIHSLGEGFVKILEEAETRMEPGRVYTSMDDLKRLLAVYGPKLHMIHNNSEYFRELLARDYPDLPHTFNGAEPDLFFGHGLEQKIDKLRSKIVPLKGGGNIVIEETEALVSIDVNAAGHKPGRDANFAVNMEAAGEIARQIQLRNLSGIIICDFISMTDDQQRTSLRLELEKQLSRDPVYSKVYPPTSLGLIEIARRRQGNSAAALLFRRDNYKKELLSDSYLYKLALQRLKKAVGEGASSLLLSFNPAYRDFLDKVMGQLLQERFPDLALNFEFSYKTDTLAVYPQLSQTNPAAEPGTQSAGNDETE